MEKPKIAGVEYVYTLAFADERGRRLTAIGHSNIAFNISSYMEFNSVEEIQTCKEKWGNHFYGGLDDLIVVIEVKKGP